MRPMSSNMQNPICSRSYVVDVVEGSIVGFNYIAERDMQEKKMW